MKFERILIIFYALVMSSLAKSQAQTQSLADSRGQIVKVPINAQRIASTSLAGDEILVQILKDQNQLQRLIAVSTFADNKEYSNIIDDVKHIKGRAGRELESLLNLKPDLIFLASYNQPAMITRLNKAKVTTFVLDGFNSFAEIKKNITIVGKVIGATDTAQTILTSFDSQLLDLKKSAPKKKYSLLNFSDSLTLNGAQTIYDDIITAAGADNLANKLNIKGWSKISVESLMTLNPDFIVAIGNDKQKKAVIARIRQTPGYKYLNAVKKGRIILVEGRTLLSVSHHVLQAAKQIQTELLKNEEIRK